MTIKFRLGLSITLVILLSGCDGQKRETLPPPPRLFNGYLCDTFSERSRNKISQGNIEILFNDTFTISGKRYVLDSILEKHFQVIHVPLFNNDYKNCVQPLMDSAIRVKYGANAKDSIIKEAYKFTESVYWKE